MTLKREEQPKEKTICGEVYFNPAKGVEFLGGIFNRQTLLHKIRLKKISCLKVGREIWIKPQWLKECIEECTQIGVNS